MRREQQQTHAHVIFPIDVCCLVKLKSMMQCVFADGFLQEHSAGSLQIVMTPQPGSRLPTQHCGFISNPQRKVMAVGLEPKHLVALPTLSVCAVGK